MDIILDACSIINLFNGGCLDKIIKLEFNFYIGDMLFDQEIVSDVQKIVMHALVEKDLVKVLPSSLSIVDYLSLKDSYNLGMGETECIALCKRHSFVICTDDRKARECSAKELGKENVIGSMFLLKHAVKSSLIRCADAIDYYKTMRSKGGFLPTHLDQNYFCR